jgi:5-aminopentanamidase
MAAKKRKNPKISLAQIRYYDTKEKHNVQKIKKYIELAKKEGSDIICFPETCVHKTDYLHLTHGLIKEIQRSCKENKIWAIITDTFKIKGQNYKTAILIDRDGDIKGKYKKINLYDDYVHPGKKVFVYHTDFAEIGIAICWDLAHPDIFKRMKRSGAEIVFCPSKWCYEQKAHKDEHSKKELALLKSMIQSRAFENLNFVAMVNPITTQKDLISYSAVASPHKIIREINKKEGLLTVKIDLQEIKKFSKIYPKKSY